MSRYSLDLLPEAEAEIREAFLWYFERSPMAARAFRAEVFAAMDALSDQAHIWAPNEDGIRKYILSHFPYTVYYELSEQRVVVFAVGHQRRKPGYWELR